MIQRPIARTPELRRRACNEHPNAFTTDAADTLRTSITLVQRPGTLTVSAVDLDIFIMI